MERTVLAEIDFGPWPTDASEAWLRDADHAYWRLIGNLHRNSQVIGNPVKGIIQDRLKSFVHLPAEDALAKQHASAYVRSSLSQCEAVFGAEPRMTILDSGDDQPLDDWRNAAYLVVYGGSPNGKAPILNDSGNSVPSYLLPIDELLSEQLYIWSRNDHRLDGLWMSCADLEVESLRALSDPSSGHRQRSRELATELEEATGKMVYTDLYRHYGLPPEEEAIRPCPLCGQNWRVQDEQWDFRCEPCRLVCDLALAGDEEDENGWAQFGTWTT